MYPPLPNHNMFKDLSPNSQCVNNIIGESITRSKETLQGKQRPGKDPYQPEPFFGSNYAQESRPCGEVPGDCSELLLSQGLPDLSPSSPCSPTTSQPFFFHPPCFCLPLTRKLQYRACGYLRHCCFSLFIFIV